MFIYSVNLPKTRLVTVIAIVLTLLCVLFLICKVVPQSRAENVETVLPPAQGYSDMAGYLESLGYTLAARTPFEEEEVQIPEVFDPVYENYEQLQQEAGFSLLPYRGKAVLRCTFLLTNHPASSQMQVRGNLLVYEGSIIGGDISSVQLDGFMQPLLHR